MFRLVTNLDLRGESMSVRVRYTEELKGEGCVEHRTYSISVVNKINIPAPSFIFFAFSMNVIKSKVYIPKYF